jgi:3-oxoacyl-[acyl-carrier protein] reductase
MKRVLITGATRGIGKSVAQIYKSEGQYVIGTGTSKLETKPEYLDEYYACNFNDDLQLNTLYRILLFKTIDILVNNAGINKIDNFCDIEPETFLEIQKINVFAPFRMCQAVLPNMQKNNWGRIINVSSVWGKISKIGRASYSASKFAIDGLTVSLANEYAQYGVLANSVAPGFIDTEMTRTNLGEAGIAQMLSNVPIGRLAQVDEVAKFIYWLGSDQNSYISGQNLAIDGGFTRA